MCFKPHSPGAFAGCYGEALGPITFDADVGVGVADAAVGAVVDVYDGVTLGSVQW